MLYKIKRPALVCAVALFFIVSPVISLAVTGVFSWHIKQPAAWQGGLVLGALLLSIYLSLRFLWGRQRWIAIGLVCWIYARNQGIDLSIAIDYLYFESIISLGYIIHTHLLGTKTKIQHNLVIITLVGMITWSLFIWGASWVGFGSASELRWLAVIMLGLSLLVSGTPRLAIQISGQINSSGRKRAAFNALIITMFFMLFAKSAVSIDYDSLWYGLVGDRTLIGSGNIFASEGLVAVVHYYPKLYEALLIPVSGIGSITAITGFTIFSWVLLIITANMIMVELRISRRVRPVFNALIATLPALGNIAITAKGDAFAAWLVCLAVLSLLKYKSTQGVMWLWISTSALIIGFQARLSVVPYVGVLVIALGFLWAISLKNACLIVIRNTLQSKYTLLFIATCILTTFVTLRTVILAGVPIVAPNAFVAIASDLGFHLKFPVGQLPLNNWVHLPIFSTLFAYLFDPSRYSHLALYWTGNVWLFVFTFIAFFGLRKNIRLKKSWPLALVGATFFIVLLGFKFDRHAGGDGNYFIVPVICLMIFGAAIFNETTFRTRSNEILISIILWIFAIVSAGICLITGSWGPGTRSFDVSYSRNPLDYATRQRDELQVAHLTGVDSFLANLPVSSRVIGEIPAPQAWWLHVRYEPIDIVMWSKPGVAASIDTLSAFLRRDKVKYVVLKRNLSNASISGNQSILSNSVASMFKADEAKRVYVDTNYEIFQIGVLPAKDMPTLPDGSFVKLVFDKSAACNSVNPFTADVSWNLSKENISSINIFVTSATSRSEHLWANVGRVGSQTTGPWLLPGSRFILRNPKDGAVILTSTVLSSCAIQAQHTQ